MFGLAVMLLSAQVVSAQAAITITPWSIGPLTGLPGGIARDAYPVIHFVADGGTAPYSWSATGLPPGLTLDGGTGKLSGTPNSAGAFTANVTVTDNSTPTPLTATQSFTINISGNLTLAIVPPGSVPSIPLNSRLAVQLSATGGAPPYAWSQAAGALPPGFTLTSAGLMAGSATATGVFNFTVQVRDGAAATATLPLSLTAVSALSGAAQSRVGILSQIASGGGWTTSLYLVNNSAAPVTFTVNFYQNDGTALPVPEQMTLANGTTSTAAGIISLPAQLDPYSTILIQSGAPSGNELSGWADVLASGPLAGYGVFDYVSSKGVASEGTVPLEASYQPTFELPYDNMNGVGTALALTNPGTSNTTVMVTVWDASGHRVVSNQISLNAYGHAAFSLTDLAPGVAGNRGIVQFTSSSGANISGLGLRVSPANAFTSIPHLEPQ